MMSPRAIALQGIGFSAFLIAVQGFGPIAEAPAVEVTRQYGGLRFFPSLSVEAKFGHGLVTVTGADFSANGVRTSLAAAAIVPRSVIEVSGGRFSADGVWNAELSPVVGLVTVDGGSFSASGVWNARAIMPSSVVSLEFGKVSCKGISDLTDDELIALLHLDEFIFGKRKG